MSHLLGLTGNIASGKTTIGQLLLAHGAARYIDADAVVHDLYRAGQPMYIAVIREFGPQFGTVDGVDRRALGALVFSDPAALRRLEALVHPAVHMAIQAELATLGSDEVAVIDAVKLLDGGMNGWCDQVWLIWCDQAEERRRLIADRGLSPAEAEARLAAQPDRTQHRQMVAAIIDNSGTLAETQSQVEAAWLAFKRQL